MAQHFAAAARTNVGLVRAGNEDAAVISSVVIAVADGMGGHAGGEVASALAIKGISTINTAVNDSDSEIKIVENFLVCVNEINRLIERSVIENPDLAGMGTTLTALIPIKESVAMLHIGDSRCYRFRKNKLMQISIDHTVIQGLVDQGAITEAEIKNHPQRSLLTQALMGRADLKPQIELLETKKGDRFLLCSDGLTGEISDSDLLTALAITDRDAALEKLMKSVLAAGAPDNVTIIIADVVDEALSTTTEFLGAAK